MNKKISRSQVFALGMAAGLNVAMCLKMILEG